MAAQRASSRPPGPSERPSGLTPASPPNEDPPVARRVCSCSGVEATTGFEPVNRGFADLRVEPLHHVALGMRVPEGSALCLPAAIALERSSVCGCPSRIRTSVHGSKVRCPTTRRRGSGSGPRGARLRPGPAHVLGQGNGAEDGTRTRDPHLGKGYRVTHGLASVLRSGASLQRLICMSGVVLAESTC
jgi:hypothetical protein